MIIIVHGWVTIHDRSRLVAQWGVSMQPRIRNRMTPCSSHSGILLTLISMNENSESNQNQTFPTYI